MARTTLELLLTQNMLVYTTVVRVYLCILLHVSSSYYSCLYYYVYAWYTHYYICDIYATAYCYIVVVYILLYSRYYLPCVEYTTYCRSCCVYYCHTSLGNLHVCWHVSYVATFQVMPTLFIPGAVIYHKLCYHGYQKSCYYGYLKLCYYGYHRLC